MQYINSYFTWIQQQRAMEGKKRSIIKTATAVQQQPIQKRALLTYTSSERKVFVSDEAQDEENVVEQVDYVDQPVITRQVDGPKPEHVIVEELMAWTITGKNVEKAPFVTKKAVHEILERHAPSNTFNGINAVIRLIKVHHLNITKHGKTTLLPSTQRLGKHHLPNISFVCVCLKHVQQGMATSTAPDAAIECEKLVSNVINPPCAPMSFGGVCALIRSDDTKRKPMLDAMAYELHVLHNRIVALGRSGILEYAGRIIGSQHREAVEMMVVAVYQVWSGI